MYPRDRDLGSARAARRDRPNGTDRTGQVRKGGWLRLRSTLAKLTHEPRAGEDQKDSGYGNWAQMSSAIGCILLDESPSETTGTAYYYLPVLLTPLHTAGLLLTPTGNTRGTYSRVGYFKVHSTEDHVNYSRFKRLCLAFPDRADTYDGEYEERSVVNQDRLPLYDIKVI